MLIYAGMLVFLNLVSDLLLGVLTPEQQGAHDDLQATLTALLSSD